jgi:hypothetical protein
MGGMVRRGMGKMARLMAISVRAFFAASLDVPTTLPSLSSTSMPSSHSWRLINTTFKVEAVATAGNGTNLWTRFLVAGARLFTLRKSKLKPTDNEMAAVTAPPYPCKNVAVFVG